MQESSSPPKILIVDDDMNNLKVTGALLRQQNYKVAVATGGKDALNTLKNFIPDLILLDVMMPDMDGMEVCQCIKKSKKHTDIPIIFLTALDDTENIVKGFDYGGVDYILKPLNTKVLLARIKTHIELKLKNEKLKNINILLEQKVTERTKELETANQELMLLDDAKSEFLNIISHEIRTPLNGIIGFAEIIKMKYDVKAIEKYMNMLNHSAKRLERFSINALLLTAIKAKKYSLRMKRININEIIDEASKEVEKYYPEIKINIENKLQENFTVDGDKNLISRCFSNLINCGLKLSLNKKSITVSAQKKDEKLVCVIKALDANLSPNDIKNIFKLFRPGNSFLDGNEGLEFPLSKLIIELHNGSINIRNENNNVIIELTFTPLTINNERK